MFRCFCQGRCEDIWGFSWDVWVVGCRVHCYFILLRTRQFDGFDSTVIDEHKALIEKVHSASRPFADIIWQATRPLQRPP